jgi:hypothetical protein
MDGVKEYWKNPLFLVGMFLCVVGTLSAVIGEHHIGIWSELAGFAIIVVAIFLINQNSEEKAH